MLRAHSILRPALRALCLLAAVTGAGGLLACARGDGEPPVQASAEEGGSVAVRGRLDFGVVDLGGRLPEGGSSLCFDQPADPCTPPRYLRVRSAGGEAVVLSGLRVEEAGAASGFELSPAVDAETPRIMNPGDVLDVALRWCDPSSSVSGGTDRDAESASAELVLEADPSALVLPLGRAAGCSDGG